MSYYSNTSQRIIKIDESNFTAFVIDVPSYGTSYFSLKKILHRYNSKKYPYIAKLNLAVTHKVPVPTMESHYNSLISSPDLTNSSLLPLAVRYIDENGTYYIERPPFKINVDFKNARAAYNSHQTKNLQIWIPWTITAFPQSFYRDYDPSQVTIHYSHKSLESLKDTYLESFLPNSHTGGQLCWSSSFIKLLQNSSKNSQSSFININKNNFDYSYWYSMILNDYFGGGWNTDLYSRLLDIISCRAHNNSLYYGRQKIKDLVFGDNDKFRAAYPMYHKYIYPDYYPDFYNDMCQKLMEEFHCSLRQAENILDVNHPNKSARMGSSADFVKFFVFMSQLSLQETLDFYTEINKVVRKYIDSHNKEITYKEFKQIVQNNILKDNLMFDDKSIHDSYLLPLNAALSSDQALYAESFSNLKTYKFNLVIINPKTDHQSSVLEGGYYSYFWSLLNNLKYNNIKFVDSVIEHFYKMQQDPELSNHTFILIDLLNNSISFNSHKDYKNFISQLNSELIEDASNLVAAYDKGLAKTKKKPYTYNLNGVYQHDYIEIKELANNQFSINDIFS